MPVYVDGPIPWPKTPNWPYGSVSHLYAAPDSIDELHSIAQSIGLKRSWFQGQNKTFPHYDLTKTKRTQALRAGALESTRESFREVRSLWQQHREAQQEQTQ